MSELMDWDGPWSPDLVNLMLPVAVEIEIKREEAFGRAAISAAVAPHSKEPVWANYKSTLREALRMVKQDQLVSRGVTREDLHAMAVDDIIAAFGKMPGIKR